jgi:hypothetical protein
VAIETRSFPVKQGCVLAIMFGGALMAAGFLALVLTADFKAGDRELRWGIAGFCVLVMILLPAIAVRSRSRMRGKAIIIDDEGVTALVWAGGGRMERIAWADVARAEAARLGDVVDLSSGTDSGAGLINAAVDAWTIRLHRRAGGPPVQIAGIQVSNHVELRRVLLQACAAKGVAVGGD